MKLEQLLEGLVKISENDLRRIQGVEIGGLAIDSRRANKGDLFMALAGSKQHGLSYAQAAIGNGVSAVLFDPAGAGNRLAQTIAGIPLIPIENLGNALGNLAARFYGEPTRHLNVMGITGTNGKTSCSQFLGQMLDDCGIIGTLGWGKWEQLNDTVNTTPDALTLQTIMAEFVNSTTKNVAMEVSSIGLDQGRVNGVQFTGAVFTNFTRDHLDYHETMSAYLDAKLQLMRMPGLKFAVINLDDDSWETIASTVPRSTTLWGVSANGNHWNLGENLVANHLEHTDQGIQFAVQWRGVTQRFKVPLYGDFNVENVLCVLSVMLAMGHRFDESATKMQSIQPIKGRMERCGTTVADMSVFVDYAHTPDALYRVLSSLRKHCSQSLWVVFGCGGDRDAGKRPEMGSIAEQWADYVIITDDNPRSEDPTSIAKEILAGCNTDKAIIIQDRKQAIKHAINRAEANDFVVIAGKGHENYQEINGIRHPFSDKLIAEAALQQRFGLQ